MTIEALLAAWGERRQAYSDKLDELDADERVAVVSREKQDLEVRIRELGRCIEELGKAEVPSGKLEAAARFAYTMRDVGMGTANDALRERSQALIELLEAPSD